MPWHRCLDDKCRKCRAVYAAREAANMPKAEKFMGILKACGGRFLPMLPSDQCPGHYVNFVHLVARMDDDGSRGSLAAGLLDENRPDGVFGRCIGEGCRHWNHLNQSDKARHMRLFHSTHHPIRVRQEAEPVDGSAESDVEMEGHGDGGGGDDADAVEDGVVGDGPVNDGEADAERPAATAAARPQELVKKVQNNVICNDKYDHLCLRVT